jgi:hypothetical protein
MRRLLFALALVGLAVGVASAAPCTKGVNCYCDRVQGGDLNDSALLWCEDWDSPQYYSPSANPNWVQGAVYGQSGWNRGSISRFALNYGNGVNGFLWPDGSPTSPAIGQSCNLPGATPPAFCVGTLEWCSTGQGGAFGRHCWNEDQVASNVGIDIIASAADVSDDVPGLTLTGGTDGGGAVFGNHAFAYRIAANGGQSGIAGQKTWALSQEIGVTFLLAYSSNTPRYDPSGTPRSIWNQAWKHEEWFGVDDLGRSEFSVNGGQQDMNAEYPDGIPFNTFMFGGSNCSGALAGATQVKGSWRCDTATPPNLLSRPNAADYNQPTHFAFGQWHCVQAHFVWSGGFFNGDTSIDGRLIKSISHFATTGLANNNGYLGVKLDSYSNINNNPGQPTIDRTIYRYYDNIHVRRGAPVSCAQVGLGSVVPPPNAPTNLQGCTGAGCTPHANLGVVSVVVLGLAWRMNRYRRRRRA